MLVIPSFRHCSNKYELDRERLKERDFFSNSDKKRCVHTTSDAATKQHSPINFSGEPAISGDTSDSDQDGNRM